MATCGFSTLIERWQFCANETPIVNLFYLPVNRYTAPLVGPGLARVPPDYFFFNDKLGAIKKGGWCSRGACECWEIDC